MEFRSFLRESTLFPKEGALFSRELEPFPKENSLFLGKLYFSPWNFYYPTGNLLGTSI